MARIYEAVYADVYLDVYGAASGGNTLTADTGTFTLTGIDAGLTYSGPVGPTHTLEADAGSFALTGIAADFALTRLIAADAGTFALTGIDASLTASRSITADTSEFTLTGIDAGLIANRTIAIAVGEFSLTGIAADLTYTPSDVPSIDTLLVTRTAEAIIRFTGTTDGNRVQYYIQAAPGSTPDESDAPTGEVTVTRNTPFDFEVEGVDVGSIRVHARAAHRGNVGSWAAL